MHLRTLILAHQYGWDKALLFAVPIVIAVLAIRWFDRRPRPNDDGDADAQ